MRRFLRHIVVAAVLAAVVAAAYAERVRLADAWVAWHASRLPPAMSFSSLRPLPAPAANAPLPATVNLAVPFTPQAPTANWDAYHEEACEEASLYMVDQFYRGMPAGLLDPAAVEKAIHAMTDFEDKTFGFNQDTTAAQTAQIARDFLGYGHVEIVEQPTADRIKAILAAGHPVIVPVDGRLIGNPFYASPGPIYHMLVLRGYTSSGFISNDPGTRRGDGYVYGFDQVMKAMHDWNAAAGQADGPPRALVVYPNP